MKTKAYKLAAELGLQEQPVLDWLRSNGYPNVRRADMIRSDVAQAARKALRDRARSGRLDASRHVSSHAKSHAYSKNVTRHEGASATPDESLSVSMAELLDEHLPPNDASSRSNQPKREFSQNMHATLAEDQTIQMRALFQSDLQPQTSNTKSSRAVDDELARLASEKWLQDLNVERAKVAGLERLLESAQAEIKKSAQAVSQNGALKAQLEALLLERTQLKQSLEQVGQERQTLEETFTELQAELADARSMIDEHESLSADHDSVLDDLNTAREREIAWRTRALKLERAAHEGDDLAAIFRGKGLDTLALQTRALKAMLAQETTASSFIKAVRQVEPSTLNDLFEEKLAATCSHPICRKVASLNSKFPIGVDVDSDCIWCSGEHDKRWFAQLAVEGERAGVRRFLVIGGREETRSRLRALAEGQPIDLRLIGDDEDLNVGQMTSRVEGCDCLVLWNPAISDKGVNEAYETIALEQNRLVVHVLGEDGNVVGFCRAAAYRIARTHLFRSA
ncbi:MAG: hypothetical protein VYA30_02750 [Myxococcota bacterium]|nr:hypothetical protein [Myxococcota bacterium]